MSFRQIIATVILLAAPCFAADVDGKWTGSMSTPNGDVPVIFNFQADGATLNGSTIAPDGRELKITNGKVDGANISFNMTVDFGGNAFVLNYKGVVSSGQIKLILDIMGMPMELIVKKA